jgi:hypothetical protein
MQSFSPESGYYLCGGFYLISSVRDGPKICCHGFQDDDCEDGEIKEPGQKKPFVRPICRFYMRGNCTWGHSCRFLHPGINDKGLLTFLVVYFFSYPEVTC